MVAENDPLGFSGYAHELDEHLPRSVGNEILDLAFLSHRRQFEQPDERLDVHNRRRFQGSLDDAKSKTVLERLPMFIEGIVVTIQPLSELFLSPRLDISRIIWDEEGVESPQDPPKAK